MAVPQKNITSTELKSVDDFFACYARWSCAIHTPVSTLLQHLSKSESMDQRKKQYKEHNQNIKL
jgi:hypothetical protein